jgi:hypothetical protein
MTLIKITISKDEGWDCEGDALETASFEWRTDGSQAKQERIASDIAKTLRVFTRTPLKAASFDEVFFSNEPTREDMNFTKEKLDAVRSESSEFLSRVTRVLGNIENEEIRTKVIDEIFNTKEEQDATKIKYE